MLTDVDNRRVATRITENVSVEFYGDDLQMMRGQTINLSSTGTRIVSSNGAAGNHFQIEVTIGQRKVAALADKVWEAPLNGTSGCAVIGLHFASMSRRDRVALHNYCSTKIQRQAERKLPRRLKLPGWP